jgi:hypothetical protein
MDEGGKQQQRTTTRNRATATTTAVRFCERVRRPGDMQDSNGWEKCTGKNIKEQTGREEGESFASPKGRGEISLLRI